MEDIFRLQFSVREKKKQWVLAYNKDRSYQREFIASGELLRIMNKNKNEYYNVELSGSGEITVKGNSVGQGW